MVTQRLSYQNVHHVKERVPSVVCTQIIIIILQNIAVFNQKYYFLLGLVEYMFMKHKLKIKCQRNVHQPKYKSQPHVITLSIYLYTNIYSIFI